jgi:hypothetical protein
MDPKFSIAIQYPSYCMCRILGIGQPELPMCDHLLAAKGPEHGLIEVVCLSCTTSSSPCLLPRSLLGLSESLLRLSVPTESRLSLE